MATASNTAEKIESFESTPQPKVYTPPTYTKFKRDENPNSIEVNHLTINYRSYKERPTSIKESVLRFVKEGKFRYHSSFEAVSDVSFNVKRGEILGIIGSNGAGKSTLLKALAGVLPPMSGSLVVRGEVDSLINLGAGFDAELNAIENIYLYSSLHQRTRKETKERIPRILEFAELEEFAHTPVKYYSSGMFARLGFACAMETDPDILLVDEVLAVGDERFNKKCRQEFDKFLDSGKTIVMVSHNANSMQKMAHRILLLSKGKIAFLGDPEEAVKRYRDSNYEVALDGKRL